MKIYLTGGEVYTPCRAYKAGAVLIEGKTIRAAGPAADIPIPPEARVIDATGKRIIPGLIDVHIHGALASDVAGEGLAELIRCLPAYGVTSFLPTTSFMSGSEKLRANLCVMAEIIAQPAAGAQALGIHMEGPWIAADRSPFSKAELCYALTRQDIERFQEASRGSIRMITFAPELGQALQVIPWLVSQRIIPSVGHTNADYRTVEQAVALGLNHSTHTFNAMQPLHHRNPGTLGAVLDFNQITAQLIADGFHVHPAAMRLLIKAKGVDRVCIVSDAVPTAELPAGAQINWEGFHLTTDGQTSRLPDGKPGGSAILLNKMLKILAQEGVPFSDAVKMSSQVPAAVLGVRKGRLEAGFDADVVVLDEDYRAGLTIIAGEIVHSL
jgi:N-acetylglucosamine-6-phosphate deacetylase